MDRRKSEVIKGLHVTEKASLMSSLCEMESNKSIRRCKSPKHTFVVANWATKIMVRREVEDLFSDQNPKVKKINIVNLPGKVKKSRKKGIRHGKAKMLKKAIVTFHENSSIEIES